MKKGVEEGEKKGEMRRVEEVKKEQRKKRWRWGIGRVRGLGRFGRLFRGGIGVRGLREGEERLVL